MDKIKAFYHKHPYWAIAIGVGLLLIIYYYFLSGSSSSTTASGNPNAALNAQVKEAGIAANAQNVGSNDALQAAEAQAQATLQAVEAQTAAQTAVATTQANAQTAQVQAQTTAETTLGQQQAGSSMYQNFLSLVQSLFTQQATAAGGAANVPGSTTSYLESLIIAAENPSAFMAGPAAGSAVPPTQTVNGITYIYNAALGGYIEQSLYDELSQAWAEGTGGQQTTGNPAYPYTPPPTPTPPTG